ncbi:MAG: RHS repeat-associated core domain-containing protein, partial [Candidatus Kapaibacterium sp.]
MKHLPLSLIAIDSSIKKSKSENQLHSINDIPKRGYVGSHKSKENGYMQMGARLYNSETGRFMSVDPLMEIFTGHSPYHYSYNNPVMFSDPSGLAPEGEKNNSTQGPGADLIGSSHTSGYWTQVTFITESGEVAMGLDDPLAPAERRKVYGTETSFVWVEGSSGAGGGGGGTSPKYSPSEVYGSTSQIRSNSSRTLPNQNSLRSKSVTDQNYVMKNNNNKNTLFMTKDAANQMKVFIGISVELGESGPLDLFEVTNVLDMFPNDNKNQRYINYIRRMINNNIEPVALSGTQKYNFSKSNNVHTPSNSSYGMRTA